MIISKPNPCAQAFPTRTSLISISPIVRGKESTSRSREVGCEGRSSSIVCISPNLKSYTLNYYTFKYNFFRGMKNELRHGRSPHCFRDRFYHQPRMQLHNERAAKPYDRINAHASTPQRSHGQRSRAWQPRNEQTAKLHNAPPRHHSRPAQNAIKPNGTRRTRTQQLRPAPHRATPRAAHPHR